MKSRGVILKGKQFDLRYDLNAWAYIEETMDVSVSDLDFEVLSCKMIKTMLIAGLMWKYKPIEIREALKLVITMEDITNVSKVVGVAVNDSTDPANGQKKTEIEEPESNTDTVSLKTL